MPDLPDFTPEPDRFAPPDWLLSWRRGWAPQLPLPALEALADGIRRDDSRLVQKRTVGAAATDPPPTAPCVCGCAVTYALWQGMQPGASITEAGALFSDAWMRAIAGLRKHHCCAWLAALAFLKFFDDGERAMVFAALLPEVEAEIERRKGVAA